MPVLTLTACTVDLERLEVRRDGAISRLSPTERDLLLYLTERPGQVVSRRELLTEVWGYAPTVRSRTPDTTLGRLRNKIEVDPSQPDHILTVRGGGWEWRLPERPTTGLPAVVDAFVGREPELAALAERVKPGTIVTVVGPAGSGRSRLVHEHAHRAVCRVLWVDVTDTDDPGALLGAALSGGGSAVEADTAARSCRADLVVIDGLTESSERLEALLLALVAHAASTAVLVTAPRSLGLPAEDVFAVPPLSSQDARALWVARSRSDADPTPLLEVLDGHPLAIELAAGRVAVLGPERLAERVRQRLDVLEDRRDGSSVQAPLSEAWATLPGWATAALVRLSPTRAGFDLDAAEALIGELDGPWSLDALDDLVRWSWVYASTGPDGHPRFHLPRLVSLFAQQNAPEADIAAAVETHARFYAKRALAAYVPAIRRLDYSHVPAMVAEIPNLVAAVRAGPWPSEVQWGLLLGLTGVAQRAPVPPLDAWLTAAMEREADAARRAELRNLVAENHWYGGRLEQVRETLLAEPAQAAREAACAEALLAWVKHWLGDPGAEQHARRALADEAATVDTRVRAAIVLDSLGHPEPLARAAEWLRPYDAPQMRASVVQQQAIRAIFQGDLPTALPLAEEALALGRRVQHAYSEAFAGALVAEIRLGLGEPAPELEEAITLFERLGQHGLVAHYRATQVRARVLSGQVSAASVLAEAAVDAALAHEVSEIGRIREAAAEVAWLRRESERARVHLQAALEAAPQATTEALLAMVEGRSPPDADPPDGPEGVHGTMRWRVLRALSSGQVPPEPEFAELMSVQVVRLFGRAGGAVSASEPEPDAV